MVRRLQHFQGKGLRCLCRGHDSEVLGNGDTQDTLPRETLQVLLMDWRWGVRERRVKPDSMGFDRNN